MSLTIDGKKFFGLTEVAKDYSLPLGEAAGMYGLTAEMRVLVMQGSPHGPIVAGEQEVYALEKNVLHGLLTDDIFLGEGLLAADGQRLIIPQRAANAYGLRPGREVALAAVGARGLVLIIRGPLLEAAREHREELRLE